MGTRAKSRRSFLIESVSGLGGVWVAANYPGILAAEEYVRKAAQSGQPTTFAFFNPEQAVEVEAMAAQIIPTDHEPGAREARVVSFIDRALVTFDRERTSTIEYNDSSCLNANEWSMIILISLSVEISVFFYGTLIFINFPNTSNWYLNILQHFQQIKYFHKFHQKKNLNHHHYLYLQR